MRSWVWFPLLGLLAGLCSLSPGLVQGGKVVVMPVDGSHWLSMKILVTELTLRGHEVVVLVPENSLLIRGSDSYRTEIYKVPYSKEVVDEKFNALKDGIFLKPPAITDLFVNVQRLVNFTSYQVKGCESLLNNKPLIRKLREEDFEIMLTDPFLPCGTVLAHILSIPSIYFLSGLPCRLDLRATQSPIPPSYVPITFSANTPTMTFPQRVKNMIMYGVESHMCSIMYQHFEDLVQRYVEEDKTYKDLLSEGAIWLLTNDFTFEWPRPVMPNTVLIGGINCAETSPLPTDLQEFVDGSGDDGFIIFTLGSMLSSMPEEKAKQFFDVFQQIPQRVVWRYTGVVPDSVPENVRLMNWLPQNDLLAHPKARVFMTHGGSHGVYEGICNGVPMLMFPLFGDQGDNVKHMVARGVAERLSIYTMTNEDLLAALNRILHDKSYEEKMVQLSRVHHDRPVEPLDLAVFWTEYVMRHKGAEHLRVAAHKLNWFQYHSLDVIGFLLVVLITMLWLTLKCCLFCFRKCCRKGTAKKKSE